VGPEAQREYLGRMRERHIGARRPEKTRPLDEAVAVTGRHRRDHARKLLKGLARRPGRFPQLVDPRSSVSGLLLTGSPRFREVSPRSDAAFAGSSSLRPLTPIASNCSRLHRAARPETCERPKAGLELRGFIHELHARILQPSVVGGPRLWLSHDLVAHYGFRRQQPQQAELREPAERQRGIRRQRLEPPGRNPVVDVPLVGERHPDVDVREIRCRRWRHCREPLCRGAWTERSAAIRGIQPSGARPSGLPSRLAE